MIVLHLAWAIWCWLPFTAQVVISFALWFGFAELLGRFCALGTRYDREIDEPRREQRAAIVRPLPQARAAHRPGTAR